jgi:hypothetical protein
MYNNVEREKKVITAFSLVVKEDFRWDVATHRYQKRHTFTSSISIFDSVDRVVSVLRELDAPVDPSKTQLACVLYQDSSMSTCISIASLECVWT